MRASKHGRGPGTHPLGERKERWGTPLGVPGEQARAGKEAGHTTHLGSSAQIHFVRIYTADFFSKTTCCFCDIFVPPKGNVQNKPAQSVAVTQGVFLGKICMFPPRVSGSPSHQDAGLLGTWRRRRAGLQAPAEACGVPARTWRHRRTRRLPDGLRPQGKPGVRSEPCSVVISRASQALVRHWRTKKFAERKREAV